MDHTGIAQDQRDLEWYRKNSTTHPPKRREITLNSDALLTIDQVAKGVASIFIQNIRAQAEEIRKRKGKK